MNAKKQKLLIENLLGSSEIFSRCCNIVQSDYFEPEYKPVIKFMLNYYDKYHNLPTVDVVNSEFDLDFIERQITHDQIQYTLDSIEKFCQDEALIDAIRESLDLIEKGEKSDIREKISKALAVSIYKKLGVNLYDDPETYLTSLLDTVVYYSTGILSLDEYLEGGLARKQTTLISGNSGAGKSLLLANFGVNYSKQGMHVLYLSLELPIDMIYLRLAAMTAVTPIKLWKQKIPEIAGKLLRMQQDGAGTYLVDRITGDATCNDIRAYIKHYELEFKRLPDVLIVDYLDKMTPNGGTKNKDITQQDKEKTEQLSEIVFEMNMIGITASQQNRSGLSESSPTQAVIAGGMSKVHTVDNYIGLYSDDVMKIKGELIASFLKTRTSNGDGHRVMLHRDVNTLVIADPKNEKNERSIVNVEQNKVVAGQEHNNKKLAAIIGNIKDMPTENGSPEALSEKQMFIKKVTMEDDKSDLLNLMSSINT